MADLKIFQIPLNEDLGVDADFGKMLNLEINKNLKEGFSLISDTIQKRKAYDDDKCFVQNVLLKR